MARINTIFSNSLKNLSDKVIPLTEVYSGLPIGYGEGVLVESKLSNTEGLDYQEEYEKSERFKQINANKVLTKGDTHKSKAFINWVEHNRDLDGDFFKSVPVDTIAIIDLDSKQRNITIPFGGSTKLYDYVILQCLPNEITYGSDNKYNSIGSISRNVPFYNYTGSEDTLEFEIDWYSIEEKREDVIRKCRWLESISKNDGYSGPPHRVHLAWSTLNKLFRNDTWIIEKAPYRLSQFKNVTKTANGNFIRTGLMPAQAYQSITLKKVSNRNLNHKDIIYGN